MLTPLGILVPAIDIFSSKWLLLLGGMLGFSFPLHIFLLYIDFFYTFRILKAGQLLVTDYFFLGAAICLQHVAASLKVRKAMFKNSVYLNHLELYHLHFLPPPPIPINKMKVRHTPVKPTIPT